LLPDSSEIPPIQFTISYTGWAYVLGNVGGSLLAGGTDLLPSEENMTAKAGTGMLSFFLSGSDPSNPQPTSPSSISVTANLGNPQGGRKAYLNEYTGDGKTSFALWRPSEGN
jgi:hypothetical protein